MSKRRRFSDGAPRYISFQEMESYFGCMGITDVVERQVYCDLIESLDPVWMEDAVEDIEKRRREDAIYSKGR